MTGAVFTVTFDDAQIQGRDSTQRGMMAQVSPDGSAVHPRVCGERATVNLPELVA